MVVTPIMCPSIFELNGLQLWPKRPEICFVQDTGACANVIQVHVKCIATSHANFARGSTPKHKEDRREPMQFWHNQCCTPPSWGCVTIVQNITGMRAHFGYQSRLSGTSIVHSYFCCKYTLCAFHWKVACSIPIPHMAEVPLSIQLQGL